MTANSQMGWWEGALLARQWTRGLKWKPGVPKAGLSVGDRPGGETRVCTEHFRPRSGHIPRRHPQLEQLPALSGQASGLRGTPIPTPEQVSVDQHLVS